MKALIIPKLTILEISLNKITESEFRECAKNNAIKSATVIKTDKGYTLVIQLTWKTGDFPLYTFRNSQRVWASLDRIVDFIERNELKLPSITLRMNSND